MALINPYAFGFQPKAGGTYGATPQPKPQQPMQPQQKQMPQAFGPMAMPNQPYGIIGKAAADRYDFDSPQQTYANNLQQMPQQQMPQQPMPQLGPMFGKSAPAKPVTVKPAPVRRNTF